MIARPAFIVAVFLVTGAILLIEGIAPARAAAPPAAPSKDEPKPVAPRLVWKTQGAQGDGTIAAVEVVGIDPSTLTALKSTGMTLERWSSFLSVRVAREGPDETKTPPPLWGSYRVEAKFSGSNRGSRWNRGFAIEPSSTRRDSRLSYEHFLKRRNQPNPGRFLRPNWLAISLFPRVWNAAPRRLLRFIPRERFCQKTSCGFTSISQRR